MKFALVGTGFIMPRHAEAIFETGGKIVDVVNTAHGDDAWKKVVSETAADCVVILCPNDLHFPVAMAAADAGKMVLCEKPLGLQSADVRTLGERPNIFSVLQLKYHPLVKALKEKLDRTEQHAVEMNISVYRDPSYYAGWKGVQRRSGGILFNLGIHYFDLLVHLFGPPTSIGDVRCTPRTCSGSFLGSGFTCNWRVSTDERRDQQQRVFEIDGVRYNFSSKDNLSFENLHRYVYRDLLEGRGANPQDSLPAIQLIENIYLKAGVTL